MRRIVAFAFRRNYGGLDLIAFAALLELSQHGIGVFLLAALIWAAWCVMSRAIAESDLMPTTSNPPADGGE